MEHSDLPEAPLRRCAPGAITIFAMLILGAVAVEGALHHEWLDAGFALAVGLHYVRDFLPRRDN